MKKSYIISLFALCLLLVSCLSWMMEKPSFVLREITIKPRSFNEISLLLGLDVQNQNRYDLTLTSFEYTLYLNNEEIGNGRAEEELRIPSSATTRIQVPVAAKFKNWNTSLKTILKGGDLPYKIVGRTEIKTAFGSLSFPFSKEGHISDFKN